MRTLGRILFAAAAALGLFAWWGIYTPAGNRAFDEMAGMIPFFAGIAAGMLAAAAALCLLIARRR